jgi:hypothetical protein
VTRLAAWRRVPRCVTLAPVRHPNPAGIRHSTLTLLAIVLTALMAAAAPAAAAPSQPAPAPQVTVPTDTAPPPGRGPQLTGRTEPPLLQRVADTLIWVWLLAVLIGAPALWAWTGRRSRSQEP